MTTSPPASKSESKPVNAAGWVLLTALIFAAALVVTHFAVTALTVASQPSYDQLKKEFLAKQENFWTLKQMLIMDPELKSISAESVNGIDVEEGGLDEALFAAKLTLPRYQRYVSLLAGTDCLRVRYATKLNFKGIKSLDTNRIHFVMWETQSTANPSQLMQKNIVFYKSGQPPKSFELDTAVQEKSVDTAPPLDLAKIQGSWYVESCLAVDD